MDKAFEYEVRFRKDGKALERRWSVGPVLITSVVALILSLTGHTVRTEIITLLKTIRWW
jgi:hypothetical protein